MSVSDTGWQRLVYVGSGLSITAIAVMMIFMIPQVKNQPGMTHGGDWVLIGIQLFIAIILFGTGFINKRDYCLTRIMLAVIGVGAILTGLVGFLAISQESEVNSFWKTLRICAIDDILIGILAIYACI